MKAKEEIRDGIAQLLIQLRKEQGLSKARMAEAAGVDARTWDKYEAGTSAPKLDEFIMLYDELDADALRSVLNFLYPDIYAELSQESDVGILRNAAVHYFQYIASERMVRKFDFLVFGEHGSNIEAQTEEWNMLNHLPLSMRLIVANLINSLYMVAESSDMLINMDRIPPIPSIFEDGLEKGEKAVKAGHESYTTATK